MQVEQKVNIHNRFDVEVNGEWVGFAENIVLNQMWNRLCYWLPYFSHIHFGTGTGTPIATRTTLFTHLGTKSGIIVEKIKSDTISSWKKKIVLNPEEYVGSMLTELGIAFGSIDNNLLTHAMLKDVEGNPITITKTDTDVVTIYATIFIAMSNPQGVKLIGLPDQNDLLNYLVDDYGFLYHRVEFRPFSNARDILGYVTGGTWSADVANKKRKASTLRFGVDVGNGDIQNVSFYKLFNFDIPQAGIFSGQPYTDVVLGAGDGSKKVFTLPSANIKSDTIVIKNNGGVVANYDIVETNVPGHAIDIQYMSNQYQSSISAAFDDSVIAYSRAGLLITHIKDLDDVYKEIAIPNAGGGSNYWCCVSGDGTKLLSSPNHLASNYAYFYKREGLNWIPLTKPPLTAYESRPYLSANGLVAGYFYNSPMVFDYDEVTNVWIKRSTAGMSTINLAGGTMSDDGDTVVLLRNSAPFIEVYDWDGSSWVIRNMSGITMEACWTAIYNVTTDTLFVLTQSGQIVKAYKYDNGVFTPISLPTSGVTNNVAFSISPDGTKLSIVGHAGTKYEIYYSIDDIWTKQSLVPGAIREPGSYSENFLTNTMWCICESSGLSPINAISLTRKMTDIVFDTAPSSGAALTSDYLVNGLHKTNQYVVDISYSIQFGEGV